MSRIKGLNDQNAIDRQQPYAGIKVWKGEKKSDHNAGRSLESEFRIEAPPKLRPWIKSAYKAREGKDGSLYCDRLNIVASCDDEHKVFDSQMAAYSASRPLRFCDRETINLEYQELKDEKGGIYFSPVATSKLCPVVGTNRDCPLGCKMTGNLYFYIWELMEAGYGELARLQMHGVKDNQNVASFFDGVKRDIGAIRHSPFFSETTKSNIVYVLTKVEIKSKRPVIEQGIRTGKRASMDEWIVNLSLHPEWATKYNAYMQSEQIKALNYQPSMRLIEQIHGTGLISGNEQRQLPSSDRNTVSFVDFKTKLAEAYRNNGWTKEAWTEMMTEYFGSTEIPIDIDRDLILAIANKEYTSQEFGDF